MFCNGAVVSDTVTVFKDFTGFLEFFYFRKFLKLCFGFPEALIKPSVTGIVFKT